MPTPQLSFSRPLPGFLSEPSHPSISMLSLPPLDFTVLWGYAEAARYLGIAEATLRDRVKRGTGPARVKMGRSRQAPVRFRPEDVQAYAAGNVVPPRAAVRGRPRKEKALA